MSKNDCYVDDGESYRGNVSETDEGDECLYWNSHFILINNGIQIPKSSSFMQMFFHIVYDRNPDGDVMPWCFFRRGRKLLWDHCDVTEAAILQVWEV
uniref:Kringle domain-containing protein n=1 Tax=Echeneis naucrates TaxID=173247 RepID=A0A665WV31_ECHNA